jgi:hypothetical protein
LLGVPGKTPTKQKKRRKESVRHAWLVQCSSEVSKMMGVAEELWVRICGGKLLG